MATLRHWHTPVFLGLAAIIAVGWLWLGISTQSLPVIATLGALVLILGLPHGALDFWVASRHARWGRGGRFTARGAIRFHVEYLSLAALTVACFVFLPRLALTGFLLLSLWHFADDWPSLPKIVRIGCAATIVLVPTVFHPAEVFAIFTAVTGHETVASPSLPYPALLVSGWIITGSIGLAAVTDKRAAAEVLGLVALAAVLPPLVFFAVYFTLLHGPRHLGRHAALVAGRGEQGVLIAYTAAALFIVVGIGLALSRFDELSLSSDALRAVFAGLAALTVPHAVLMEADRRRVET